MTKAIICIECVDLRMLRPSGPVTCECGNVTGEWVDAAAGSCRISAHRLDSAVLMGLNNGFLVPGLRCIRDDGVGSTFTTDANKFWRVLHDVAAVAPGYYFDASMRNCWAILMGHRDAVAGVEWVKCEAVPDLI